MVSHRWLKHYQPGVPADIEVEWCSSVGEIFVEACREYADLPAFSCLGKVLTYRDVDRLSGHFASYLQNHLNLKKGDRIALMMPNILQFPIAMIGAFRAGLVVVNVNPLYTPRELGHQLADSGAVAIVILANFASVLQKVMAKTPVQHVVVTQVGDLLGFPKSFLVNGLIKYVKKQIPPWHLPRYEKFNQVLAMGSRQPSDSVETDPGDLAFLQYTGGTTGVSKGAMLTHRNILANVAQSRAWIGVNLEKGKEIIITPLPLYHIFSLTANLLTFSSLGCLNVLIPNPRDLKAFIGEMKKWPFTAMTGVNTLFNALVNHPDFTSVDCSHLKMSLGGGMAVQRAVAERWQEVTQSPLVEAYGLTETSPAACINPLDQAEYNGFIGLPICSTEVSIRADNGTESELGKEGELCVRGPQVMKGYWNRPEETAQVFFPDGWLRTGDVATMNEDGYIKIVDRKKDMILVSGFNVFPNEIEDVIAAHPGVLEVAAVGVPDPKSTEAVKVFVVRKDPQLTEVDIKAFAREQLTPYKCPRLVEFREELPKTNVGKILRRALRET